ncbi:hypothetical protein MRB53_040763 [Persea americana]|nr:hypothetical protein MRB53_040763 [Persea americana]
MLLAGDSPRRRFLRPAREAQLESHESPTKKIASTTYNFLPPPPQPDLPIPQQRALPEVPSPLITSFPIPLPPPPPQYAPHPAPQRATSRDGARMNPHTQIFTARRSARELAARQSRLWQGGEGLVEEEGSVVVEQEGPVWVVRGEEFREGVDGSEGLTRLVVCENSRWYESRLDKDADAVCVSLQCSLVLGFIPRTCRGRDQDAGLSRPSPPAVHKGARVLSTQRVTFISPIDVTSSTEIVLVMLESAGRMVRGGTVISSPKGFFEWLESVNERVADVLRVVTELREEVTKSVAH